MEEYSKDIYGTEDMSVSHPCMLGTDHLVTICHLPNFDLPACSSMQQYCLLIYYANINFSGPYLLILGFFLNYL